MAVRKLTKEEKQEIVNLLKSGLSSKEIVKKGAPVATLGQIRAVKAWITMGHYNGKKKHLAKKEQTIQDLLSTIDASVAELRLRLN
jgi:hypothetical protein